MIILAKLTDCVHPLLNPMIRMYVNNKNNNIITEKSHKIISKGVGSCGSAILIIRTHLYRGKSHSYGVTVNSGGAPAPGIPLLPTPMIRHVNMDLQKIPT